MPLSHNAQELRAKDNDKYLAALFAPEDKREKIIAAFLFHYEIYNIPQTVSEPMVGKIKLQWWRDVLQEIKAGKPARPHPILQALKDEKNIIPHMETILDSYDKMLDGYQPKTMQEIEEFLKSSVCIPFKISANILEKDYEEQLALAYGYQFLANKILQNKESAKKFATEPETLIDGLIKSSINNLSEKTNAFSVITKHHIKNLKKQKSADNGKWLLILKLLFKKLEVL